MSGNSLRDRASNGTSVAFSSQFLLLYCISDLSPSSGYRELHNLPFVTLADGRTLGRFSVLPAASPEHVIQLTSMGFTTLLSLHALRKFSGNLESAIEWLFDHRYEASSSVVHGLDPYFVCGGAAAEILSTSPHMYVDEESLEDAPVLSKLYKSPSLQQVMNVTSLTPEMLGDVVNRAIPPDWRGEEEVEWDCNDAGASPSREWFSSLWSYICSNPASIPHVAEQYCLVPTNEGIVTNLSRGSSTISAALLSAPVIDAVTSLGIRTLLTGLFDKGGMKVPSEIFSYVFEPTPESVIFAIDAASRRGQQNWVTMTPEKKEVLYDYLVTSAPKLPVAATRVLASFPIFQVYSSEGLCFSDLTGGGICTLSAPPTASDAEVFSAMASISKVRSRRKWQWKSSDLSHLLISPIPQSLHPSSLVGRSSASFNTPTSRTSPCLSFSTWRSCIPGNSTLASCFPTSAGSTRRLLKARCHNC